MSLLPRTCLLFNIFCHTLLKILLFASGDIELNPGPYAILKCIQASFHQGHEKFGNTRGIQCSCISLFSICFSTLKAVSRWTCNDLEYILEQGDTLYKQQNSLDFLSAAETLPLNVNSFSLEASTVSGYITGLSPIKTLKNKRKYFDFPFHAEEDVRRAVCFSPEKRELLKTIQENSSGCVIKKLSFPMKIFL